MRASRAAFKTGWGVLLLQGNALYSHRTGPTLPLLLSGAPPAAQPLLETARLAQPRATVVRLRPALEDLRRWLDANRQKPPQL